MAGVEQARRVRPGRLPLRRHHDAFARGQTVVLDHPRGLTARWAEAVQSGVEIGRIVHDLADRRPHTGGGHDVLGEGLRTLDARGVLGGTEARYARGPEGVGDAEHQRHLRTDDDEVGADAFRQGRDGLAGRRVDFVLIGDGGGACVARRDRQPVDLRVSAQRKQQRVFTGSGSNYQDVHRCPP